MKKWKALVDSWILADLIEEWFEVSLKILVKLIEKKFFMFVKSNNIVFSSKEEELELKKYFKEKYLRNVTNKRL